MMNKVNNLDVIDEMRTQYYDRLIEMVSEVDVLDDAGNVIVSPGLKVRHKKSQFEYTVDSVIEDPATGDVQIVLNNPEEPRFVPSLKSDDVLMGGGQARETITEVEPTASVNMQYATTQQTPDIEGHQSGLVVSQEEFEKEYEVR